MIIYSVFLTFDNLSFISFLISNARTTVSGVTRRFARQRGLKSRVIALECHASKTIGEEFLGFRVRSRDRGEVKFPSGEALASSQSRLRVVQRVDIFGSKKAFFFFFVSTNYRVA